MYRNSMSSIYEQASFGDDSNIDKHDDNLEPQEVYSSIGKFSLSKTTKHHLVRSMCSDIIY